MPGVDALKVILSQKRPSADALVEVDKLYVFLNKNESRSFHFLIDHDGIPTKINESGIYPGLGKNEKGFILHNNELYFIDNAASEGAEKKLKLPEQGLIHLEVDMSKARVLTFDEVKSICRYTHFSSNSIKSEINIDPVRVVYRLNKEDKIKEIAINNWPEIKSGEISALVKILQSLDNEKPIPISSELETNIKKAFLANSVEDNFDFKAEEEEKLRIMRGAHYVKKIEHARDLREKAELLEAEVKLYDELLKSIDHQSKEDKKQIQTKPIIYTGKFQEEFKLLEKEIEQLKEDLKSPKSKQLYKKTAHYLNKIVKYSGELNKLLNKLDTRIETLKTTMGAPKTSNAPREKKHRIMFSPTFFQTKPKTFDDIDKTIDHTENLIQRLQNKIETRRKEKNTTLGEIMDNSSLSLSNSEFRFTHSLKSPKSATEKKAKLKTKPRRRSHK